ncbi:MAG: hypothetical protein HFG26_01995 [Provencibacterium sp.]|jgi:hypothetical protein|nr:hypothetical protein [Provencibacterium sp.]
MKEPILKWIYAGPFTLDVSDRYQDNYIVSAADYADYWDEARRLLCGLEAAREGEPLSLFGQDSSWKYVRVGEAEKKITFAGFGVYARLMAVILHTKIIVKNTTNSDFSFWFTGSAAVRINGREVFCHTEVGRCSREVSFSTLLEAGENDCEILLFNVHLHCTDSFSLLADAQLNISPPLLPGIPDREALEEQLSSFYLEKTLIYPGEGPQLCTDHAAAFPGELCWELVGDENKDVAAHPLCAEGRLCFKDGRWAAESLPKEYAPGSYLLRPRCRLPSGASIPGPFLSFQAVRFFPKAPENADYLQRRDYLITCLAQTASGQKQARTAVFSELAKLLSGKTEQFSEENVLRTLRYINARYDCSDFALHGVLRLYAQYSKSGILTAKLVEALRQCILNFKYWVDEPGKSMMFTRSENHEMLFHSAEYVAGQLFPNEIFPNSGQTGLFHSLKGQMLSERWIREKGRWGYTEWLSNTYYEEDMLALLSIYDFGEENAPFRRLAKNLLDFTAVLIVCHQHHGVMATTHGRCYEQSLMYPETEAVANLNWLLLGEPKRLCEHFSIGATALCGSGYRPPENLEKLAAVPLWTKTRMGMFQERGGDGVNCSTYRTNRYMVSGLVESRAGEHGGQVNAGQILLEGCVPVFVTCFDNKSATTRPSYWGGQYVMPKTAAYKNFLGLIYKIETVAGYTHCYFPEASFDETACENGWWFGRKGGAYAAVYSEKPAQMVREGDYRGRELLCMEKENVWLLEAGSAEESGSFAEFMGHILAARIVCEKRGLTYDSPSVGHVFLSWDSPCLADGKPLLEKPFPLIGNRYLFSEYGSGVIQSPVTSLCLHFGF